MEKAIISLSFDDGRKDSFKVLRDLLSPRGIPATFNITSGFIDGTLTPDKFGCKTPPLTVDEIIQMYESSACEIALHGDMHKNTEDDIKSGAEKITKWLDVPEDTVFGFASPGGEMTSRVFNSMENYAKTNISYMRCDMRILRSRRIKLLARKASRIVKFPFIYRFAFSDTLMKECPDRTIYSSLILNGDTPRQIISLIDYAVKKKAALTLTFHTIAFEEDPDKWSWSAEKFEKVCDHLVLLRDSGKADILTTADLYKKIS
ncbi:MAG: polysaccharide deacetylase family protein [Clostridia bacterium]|nr:polysaccharide deacetylase family protein [Clostridia bacterium]